MFVFVGKDAERCLFCTFSLAQEMTELDHNNPNLFTHLTVLHNKDKKSQSKLASSLFQLLNQTMQPPPPHLHIHHPIPLRSHPSYPSVSTQSPPSPPSPPPLPLPPPTCPPQNPVPLIPTLSQIISQNDRRLKQRRSEFLNLEKKLERQREEVLRKMRLKGADPREFEKEEAGWIEGREDRRKVWNWAREFDGEIKFHSSTMYHLFCLKPDLRLQLISLLLLSRTSEKDLHLVILSSTLFLSRLTTLHVTFPLLKTRRRDPIRTRQSFSLPPLPSLTPSILK
jgi:hypothetical protein